MGAGGGLFDHGWKPVSGRSRVRGAAETASPPNR
jgi:hypothetical protein